MQASAYGPLNHVMDLLLDAVCVVDADGRFVFASAAFERIFGYTPQEIVGRPMIDLVFPADRAHWTPGSRRIRMTRPASDGTFTVRGLPPGEYFLAAPLDLETGEWNDPALLDQLVKSSVTVTLREGETTTQNYRMGGA